MFDKVVETSITLRRKSRVTRSESRNLSNALSSLWVVPKAHGNSEPRQDLRFPNLKSHGYGEQTAQACANGFLSIAQKAWEEYPSASTARHTPVRWHARYAVAGDPAYRQQSEWMLEVAREKTGSNPSDLKNFQEYAERIHYRLVSRQIINKAEYDRRCRIGKQTQ